MTTKDKEQDPDHDWAALTREVKAEARRLGFDLAGVTTPDPPPHLDVYARWLDLRHHGEMAYLAAPRAVEHRADPRRVLPGCRSILVVASNYLPPSPHAAEADSPAKVAAYAQGDDYHTVLLERLERLVGFLETRVGAPVPHRIYTDTGPLLERELAQRAGLGWIGKNTCLIHPEHGSYFFLAEALLAAPLMPDEPMRTDHCGSCTRCIEACPTECILPDRTLDAGRCISYLTIELRGAIPPSLRSEIGDWVFGCDVCQQVCPWNERFAEPTGDPAFQSRAGLRPTSPDDYLALEDAAYRETFSGSAIKRAKRRGLLRNAAVAAGNRQDPSSVPSLARALLQEPEPLVRAHAAWALGRIGGGQAHAALRSAQSREADPEVQNEIALALSGEEGAGAAE